MIKMHAPKIDQKPIFDGVPWIHLGGAGGFAFALVEMNYQPSKWADPCL